jgi:hypothetical protein
LHSRPAVSSSTTRSPVSASSQPRIFLFRIFGFGFFELRSINFREPRHHTRHTTVFLGSPASQRHQSRRRPTSPSRSVLPTRLRVDLTRRRVRDPPACVLPASAFQRCRRPFVVFSANLVLVSGTCRSRAGDWSGQPPPSQRLRSPADLRCAFIFCCLNFPCNFLLFGTVFWANLLYWSFSLFLSLYFCCVQVGGWEGLKGLVPLILTPLPTPYETTLSGGQFSWSLCQEIIGPRHSFDAFPFNFCLLYFLLGCPARC